MRLLYAASEATPYIKTGGLADVAGSLPKALQAQGIEVFRVMPLYSRINDNLKDKLEYVGYMYVDLEWRHQYAGIFSHNIDGVVTYFIDNEYYFKRDGLYGFQDDGERFVFLNKAVTMLIKHLDLKPDIVHANDWHLGLLSLYIKDFAKGDDYYKNIKSVYTIHNLKYQGIFPESLMKLAGLSRNYFHDEGVKFYDTVNMMKAGIVYCDALTTVSKTYAEEIRYEFYGEKLQGIIRRHENKLCGIVNGIDYNTFNPEKDTNIKAFYNKADIDLKKQNKKELQARYGLPIREHVPLIGMVSRLVAMKGLDLVRYILDELLQEDVQIVVLGTGDSEYEEMFKHFEWKYPEKLSAHIYFNEVESHLVYAGSDLFLMPSLAEPCGISQLIALRYGALPIVREAGGLKDTVIPYNKFTGEGNGFGFANYNAHELLFAIKGALLVYSQKEVWDKLVIQAMEAKHDWEESSIEYKKLYDGLIDR